MKRFTGQTKSHEQARLANSVANVDMNALAPIYKTAAWFQSIKSPSDRLQRLNNLIN